MLKERLQSKVHYHLMEFVGQVSTVYQPYFNRFKDYNVLLFIYIELKSIISNVIEINNITIDIPIN